MSFGVLLVCPLILSWSRLPASARSAVPAMSASAAPSAIPAFSALSALPATADPAWAAAAVPMRTSYTWSGGGGGNHRWDGSMNWSGPGGCPSTCYDNAIIPYVNGGYDVTLVTEEIDDLTIDGDVELSAPGSSDVTLTVESLTIVGGVVTFKNHTRIETSTTCQP